MRRFSLRLSCRDDRFSLGSFGISLCYGARLAGPVILFNKMGGRGAEHLPACRCLSVGVTEWILDHNTVFKNRPDQAGQVGCSSAFFWTGPHVLLSRLRQEVAFLVMVLMLKTDSQRDELRSRGLMGLASRCGFPGSIGGMTCCVDS